MLFKQVFNFSAGPSKLPDRVVEQIGIDLYDWEFQGSSVMEISHRSQAFMALVNQAETNLRNLMAIPDNYKVLYFQGGASAQFAAVPMNLPQNKGKALYLNSGRWSKLASKEAAKYTKVDNEQLCDLEGNLSKLDWTEQAQDYDYVHICANETVDGIELFDDLLVGDTPLVVDMSSNIMSRPMDVSKYAVIYAGAQKNIGIAGLTLVIVREDLLGHQVSYCPKILDWQVAANNDSMINTPCTFAWYVSSLVYQYHLDNGGLELLGQQNLAKAQLLYDYIDQSDFYYCKINKAQRSLMNVCFTTGINELDLEIAKQAARENLKALKGHKAVGGFRASIYNAMPLEGVQALIEFLEKTKQLYLNSKQDYFLPKLDLNHRVDAVVQLPGSKSISNRSLLLAALAQGNTKLHDLLDSDDTKHMITALTSLGIKLEDQTANSLMVNGTAGNIKFDKDLELFLGNAGTAFRPLVAVLAANQGSGVITITGEPRLKERPIAPLVDALQQLGAKIEYLEQPGYAPLKIYPNNLKGGVVTLDASLSSQFLSALLMVGPILEQGLEIKIQGELISKPYIDLTIAMLKSFGVTLENDNYQSFKIAPQSYQAQQDYFIEPDASSASYFLALGAIAGKVTVKGIGTASLQGDKLFAQALEQAGAKVEYQAQQITVSAAPLQGVSLDLNHIPDAAMTLAMVAVYATGDTTISNIGSWRHKETDRIAAISNELEKLGVKVTTTQDSITISPNSQLKGAEIATYNDHRIAMCFSLLSYLTPLLIKDYQCVNKTFPDYFALFSAVTGSNK